MDDVIRMLRYNTGTDKKAFVKFKNDFDAVIFNATIVAYSGAAVADLVSVHKNQYIIDPQTHILQHSVHAIMSKKSRNGQPCIKKSVQKYLEQLPPRIQNIISNERRPLSVAEMRDVIDDLTQSIYEFETKYVDRFIEKKEYSKEKLLSRYAVVEIRQDSKVLYQGAVDGNVTGAGWSMKENISLGDFAAGEGKSLVVKLSLSEEMDNQYQSLLGRVNWVFSAQGAGKREEDPDGSEKEYGQQNSREGNSQNEREKVFSSVAASPKTGDETKAAVKWLALFGALAAMAVSSWRLYRKESQDE